MRPDLEDYEELQPGDDAPRSRAMSWLVLGVAVGGFAALAYYAYHAGTAQVRSGDMMVVQADESPIKQAPADPEGEQFANKDKTIYDVISPSGSSGASHVEKLLPEPEKPMLDAQNAPVAEEPAAANTPTTFINKQANKTATTVDPVDVQSLKQPAPAEAPVAAASVPAAIAPKPAAPAPLITAAASEPAGAPKFINEAPATAKKPTAEPVKKPVAKPAAPKDAKKEATKKPATGGAYQVQLGAYKSEDEAKASWKKIAAKFSGVLSGGPNVVKADLPNGTFYRLRTGGFASSDAAKAACAKLSAQGQACMPVGK